MRFSYILSLFVGLIITSTTTLFGQRHLTIHGMNNLSQSMYTNPAFRPKVNVFVALPLPMQTFSGTNNGFPLNELFVKNTSDSLVLNTDDAFFDKMPSLGYVNFQMQNELLSFGFKVKKHFISFNLTNNLSYEFNYTPDYVKFLIQGNGGSLMGQRADFDGLGVNVRDYISYAFGYNYELSDKLIVGGKLKLLAGVSDVTTKSSTIGITTGAGGLSLGIDGSASVNTSNAAVFFDSTTTQTEKLTSFQNSITKFGNFGLALDLGGTYQMTEKIALNASVIDLGYIRWKSGVKNYDVKQFDYVFNGVDVGKYLTDTVDVLQTLTDSVSKIFKDEENNTAYTSGLATKFYLGGTYKLNNYFDCGVLWYNEFVRGSYRPGLVLSSTVNVKSWLTATLNYGMYARSYNNLGLGLSLRGGPIQFFIVTDNLLAIPMLNLAGSRSASLSLGMNLVFGKGKKPDAAPSVQ
jgi:hypothetical protein